jgi:RNA polymerase sigma factor (sigma-70 family)
MYLLIFLFLSVYIASITHARPLLLPSQVKSIRFVIQNPNITPYQRNTIRDVLFSYYVDWARYKAYQFKKQHRYICKNCRIDDLIAAAMIGLHKSTRHYNGAGSFTHYANYYIQGELYACARAMKPFNIPNLIPEYIPIEQSDYTDYWTTILSKPELTPFQKKILEYKFSYSFDTIRNNKEVAELMACSEETVRLSLKKIITTGKYEC